MRAPPSVLSTAPLARRGSSASAMIPPDYHRRATCRICRSKRITEFLSFGPMPLANAYRDPSDLEAPEPRYNLSVTRCHRCGLVQVPDVVSARRLFGTYSYFSSASWPMVEHFRRVANEIRAQYLRDPGALICEIGSNDGVFLQNLVGKCRVIGIDPADNITATAALKGVPTINRFFDPQTARAVRSRFGPAKVIFAANCLAHMDDLHGMMQGVIALLADDGVLVFENHRFADMVRTRCFDQIYHEHLAYYTLRPLEALMTQVGMRVIDVRIIPTHGQSFQIHAARVDSAQAVQSSVERIREEEDAMGLDDPATYQRFERDVAALRKDLVEMLRRLKDRGHRIVGYGAPAKGTILLNYCGVGRETLDYIVDSTPIKQGRYLPGTRIPIVRPEILNVSPPDYLLLLAWNYADAILRQEQPLRQRGARFILPMPKPQVI